MNTSSNRQALGVVGLFVFVSVSIDLSRKFLFPGFIEIMTIQGGWEQSHLKLMLVPITFYIQFAISICLIVRLFKELRPLRGMGLTLALSSGFVAGIAVGVLVGYTIPSFLLGGFTAGMLTCLFAAFLAGLLIELK